jgi:uncharacterized protein (DUF1778 family)
MNWLQASRSARRSALKYTADCRTLTIDSGGFVTRSVRQERLEIRVAPAQKRLIERAAQLRGSSVTEFVVASMQDAANAIIQDFEILRLHDESRETFVNALLNPPKPNQAALIAAARYKKQMGL